MRALLLTPELFRAEGGIARIMRTYLKALAELAGSNGSVDCVVLNDAPGRDPRVADYGGDRVRHVIGCERRRLPFIWQTIRLGRASDHLVCGHIHLLPVARLARVFNHRLQYSLVAHGIEVWRPYTLAERLALAGAHRILCVSEYTRRQLRRFQPSLRPEALCVVANALDPAFTAAPVSGPATRATPGPVLLSVGRLSAADAYKGYDTIIEALPLIRREYPTARLRLVGTGDDAGRLRRLAASLNLAEAVEFAGGIPDDALRAAYAACDILVLPSSREGFGLVFLEAMYFGKACIGARAGGAPEVITEEVGCLVTPANIPELAAAVVELIRHPRDSEVVRRHAASFAFPVFSRRLATALS